MELQYRLDSLEDARANGSISQGQYASRAATLQTEVNDIQRMGNETATVSETLPRETLEANGVNATAIQTLRQNAATTTGPEVAAVTRTIAGPGAGHRPPERAGGAGDRPGGDGTDTTSDGNGRSGSGDDADNAQRTGDSGSGDDAQRNGEQGRYVALRSRPAPGAPTDAASSDSGRPDVRITYPI